MAEVEASISAAGSFGGAAASSSRGSTSNRATAAPTPISHPMGASERRGSLTPSRPSSHRAVFSEPVRPSHESPATAGGHPSRRTSAHASRRASNAHAIDPAAVAALAIQHPAIPFSLGSLYAPSSLSDLASLEHELSIFLREKFGLLYEMAADHVIVNSREQLQEMKETFGACSVGLTGCWMHPSSDPVYQKIARWKFGHAKKDLFSFAQMDLDEELVEDSMAAAGTAPPTSNGTSSHHLASHLTADTRSIVVRHLPLRCGLTTTPLGSHPRCVRPSHICYSTTRILRSDRELLEELVLEDEFHHAREKFLAEVDRIARQVLARRRKQMEREQEERRANRQRRSASTASTPSSDNSHSTSKSGEVKQSRSARNEYPFYDEELYDLDISET
jgi:hypothetical protein